MPVNAFVLPYPGRSVGVVFWDVRTAPRRSDSGPAARDADQFAVYAPGELSPGEVALLQARYVASLGAVLHEAATAAALSRPLAIWWVGGLVAAGLLMSRLLEAGPGLLASAWLALIVALSALPVGARPVGWPFRSRRVDVARRLARSAGALEPAAGAEPRWRERVDALWQAGRRLRGAPEQQLRELEGWCREHAWRQAADFYARERRRPAREASVGRTPGRFRFLGPRGDHRAGGVFYSATEMRAW